MPPALLFDADVLRPIEMSLQEGLLPKTVADVKGVARIPSFAVLLSHFGVFGVPVVEEKELQIFFCLMATSLIRRMDDREIAWWIISLEFGCEILFWNNWLLIVASKEFERWNEKKFCDFKDSIRGVSVSEYYSENSNGFPKDRQ